jgi:hypothetical protein
MRFFRFNDSNGAGEELVLPVSAIRGFDVTAADAMAMYFDGIGAKDAGGVLTFTITSGKAKDILKAYVNAASSSSSKFITFLDEDSGDKLHADILESVETSL